LAKTICLQGLKNGIFLLMDCSMFAAMLMMASHFTNGELELHLWLANASSYVYNAGVMASGAINAAITKSYLLGSGV
jgi:hypothetical protein